MSQNFPCSPQGGKLSQLKLYRQNYTGCDIYNLIAHACVFS